MNRILPLFILFTLYFSLCYAADASRYRQDNTYIPPSRVSSSDRSVKSDYGYEEKAAARTAPDSGNYYRATPQADVYQPDYESDYQPPKNQNIYRPPGRYTNDLNYNYNASENGELEPVKNSSWAIPFGVFFLIIGIVLYIILKS